MLSLLELQVKGQKLAAKISQNYLTAQTKECTINAMTEKQATSAANKLLRQMKTFGWHIEVWENLGWHYGLLLQTGKDSGVNLCVSHSREKITYFCLASRNYLGSGETQWTDGKFFADPNDAFAHQVKLIKKENQSTEAFLAAVKNVSEKS